MSKMKLGFVLATSLVGLGALAGTALYDGFEDYDVGAKINGLNKGTGFQGAYIGQSGTSPDATYVVDGGLVYQGGTLKVDGGNRRLHLTKLNKYDNAFRRKTNEYSGDVFYFSFLLRTDAATVAGADQDDMAFGFYKSDAYPPFGVAIGGNTATKYFRGRVLNVDGPLSSVAFAGDTTYFVVCKVEKTQKETRDRFNKVSILVNPTSDVEPTVWSDVYEYTDVNNATAARWETATLYWINFGVKLANQEDDDWYDIDELRAGTAWSDVVVNSWQPADAVWQGGGTTKDWSVEANWHDDVLPDGVNVAFGKDGLTTADIVNNVVSSDTAVKSLVFTNAVLATESAAYHVTEIESGKTLEVTGANANGHAFAMTGPSGFDGGRQTVAVKMTGGGDFKVSGGAADIVFQLNGYSARGDVYFDAAGLNSVDLDCGTFAMGRGENTLAKVWLAASGAASNVIKAAYIGVGDSFGTMRYPATSELYLGQENCFYADVISIGASEPSYGNRASGFVAFATGLDNPSLKIRARDGASRVSVLTIGSHGTGNAHWYNTSGLLDLSAGELDLLADALVLGDGRGYWDLNNQRGESIGILKMAAGQADVNSLVLGRSTYNEGSKELRSYPAAGRLVISGGDFTVNGDVDIAHNASNLVNNAVRRAYQCVEGELTLSGGSFTAGGPIVLATHEGHATSVVARVSVSAGVLSAHGGLYAGRFYEGDNPVVTWDGSVSVGPGGTLAVTNETGDAELRLESGTLTLGGGLVWADQLTMTNEASVVALEMDSTDWQGGVTVSGTVRLGGTLKVTLPDGVAGVRAGTRWKIAEGSARIGEFETLDVPERLDVMYTAKGVYCGRRSGLAVIFR